MTPDSAKAHRRADADRVVLRVSGLHTHFFTDRGIVKAVDDVNFSVREGEVLGLVGESGCGKTITSLSIMRLISRPGRIVAGEVVFNGQDLLALPHRDVTRLRGDRMSMIFQQPKVSLNPVKNIGTQIAELFVHHRNLPWKQAWDEAVERLRIVEIPSPAQKALAYPHELSGGQAQRVMIAMALALNPPLVIADEPTTALDVTVQAQILDLLRDMCKRLRTALILVTHDLGVIAEMADRVAVMYAGQIVEQASVLDLFEAASHPYTQGLLASMPVLGRIRDRLDVIPGTVPSLIDVPQGCRFAARCRARVARNLGICGIKAPPLINMERDHQARCWLYARSPVDA